MTDPSISPSAPPVLSEPENPLGAQAPVATPVYSSRREARAAGRWSVDAAAPVAATPPAATPPAATLPAAAPPAAIQPAAPAEPSYDGIASLFPLLGDVSSSPLTTDLAAPSAFDAILAPSPTDLGATQAIPAVEIAAELATPVGPYVVPQSAAAPIVPSWAAAEGSAASVAPAAADPLLTARRLHAAPARAAGPQPLRRGRSAARRAARGATTNRAARGATTNGAARGATTNGAARGATTNRRAAPGTQAGAKPLRQRIFGVGVMVAVGGLFAVLAIPAYADNNAATLHAAAAVQTQKVAVANSAASTIKTTARDAYTATSAADLKSLYAAAMREQNIAAYLQSGAKAKGDDYPWFAELSRNQGGGLSPLGYYYRECVDFVAWRLNRDAGTTSAPFTWTWSKLTPNGGDGRQWKSAWLAHGWPTGTTPVPGSVAWFGSNHVAYVNGILDNGQVLIEEYNYVPHAYDTRVINASDAYYLYAPPG
ncbi:MAG TPA: CHAP domain-containing protein [Pseudolysinimonas sp.]|nr:CHAP domain-containing protein [Pseudolysinimonas sp.]